MPNKGVAAESRWLWRRKREGHKEGLFSHCHLGHDSPELGRSAKSMNSSLTFAIALVMMVTVTLGRAQEPIRLSYINMSADVVADLYSQLTGKKVSFSAPEVATRIITVDTGSALLDRERAPRFIESALYIHGIEVQKVDNEKVLFYQFAVIKPRDSARRTLRRPE